MEINEDLKIRTTENTLLDINNSLEQTNFFFKLLNFETKEFDDATWLKVYYTNSKNGTVFWKNEAELLNTFQTYKWSILGMLDSFYNSDFGGYELLLEYPTLNEGKYIRWKQTSNMTRTTSSVTGYSLVKTNLQFLGNGWGGLSKSADSDSTIIDGSPSSVTRSWYYAIGQKENYDGGIPSNSAAVQEVYLWIRIK